MEAAKWSDDTFLDRLRQQTDPLADNAVARLIEEGGIKAANQVFQNMHADGKPLPTDCPGPLREFIEQTSELPSGIDEQRLDRAGEDFFNHSLTAAVVMLASSLPQGYSAPCLNEILTISGDLRFHPYKRLLGVIQLLVNISSQHAFKPGGLAVVTAQKLRLLHAGVRTVVPKYRPDYVEKYDSPVNHEDMLATLMAFSYLVIDGLRTLKVGLTAEEEEDYYYMWRVFAQMMGHYPEDRRNDDSLIPRSVREAEIFYQNYARRNYTLPDQNPSGPELTRENLEMMKSLIPKPLRRVGFDKAPEHVMSDLLGEEGLARVGMKPSNHHGVLEGILHLALKGTQWAMHKTPHISEVLAHHLFQDMINHGRGGEVKFIIPDSLTALRSPGLV